MSVRRSLRWIEQRQTAFAFAVLAAALLGAAVLYLLLQRDLFYASDETTWLLTAGAGGKEQLLQPDNGHLVVFPFLVARLVLEMVGPGYSTFTVLGVLGALAAGTAMFEYGRRRVGPLWALAPALIVLFLGSGWPQLLQGFIGMKELWPLALGLTALLLVEEERRWADLCAVPLLTLALASHSTGVAFTVGVAVMTLLGRERWRRAYVWAIPAVLYIAWRIWALKFGDQEGSVGNLVWLPGYFVDSVSLTVFGVFGRSVLLIPGQVTALKLNGWSFDQFASAVVWTGVVAVAVVLFARPVWRRGGATRPLLAALAVLVTQWVAQCYVLGPIRSAAEVRYAFADTFILLLVVLAALEGRRLSRLAQTCIALLVAVALLGMVPALKDYRAELATYSRDARADLAVFELGSRHVDPNFVPATSAPGIGASSLYLSAGGYHELERRYGSFAMPLGELKREPEEVRRGADGVSARALGVSADPQPALSGCTPARGGMGAIPLPRGGALVRASAPSQFSLRRFGAGFGPPLGHLPGGEFARIVIPPDRDPTPWHLAAPMGGHLIACSLHPLEPTGPG